MLEIIFERMVRHALDQPAQLLHRQHRGQRSTRIRSVRFGDYVNSIPLPAMLAVFKAEEWDNFGLVTVESSANLYAVLDTMLGGKRSASRHRGSMAGRSRLDRDEPRSSAWSIALVLTDAEIAFRPLSPVTFTGRPHRVEPALCRPSRARPMPRSVSICASTWKDAAAPSRSAPTLCHHRADP